MTVTLINSYRYAAGGGGGGGVTYTAQASSAILNTYGSSVNLSLATNNSGELMIAGLVHRQDTPALTVPTGWTLVGTFVHGTSGASLPTVSVWRKNSAGSEATLTIPANGGDIIGAGFCIVHSGQNASPIEATSQASVSFATPLNVSSVAGTNTGMRIIICGADAAATVCSVGTSRTSQTSSLAYINARIYTDPIVSTGTISGGAWTNGATDLNSTNVTISVLAA